MLEIHVKFGFRRCHHCAHVLLSVDGLVVLFAAIELLRVAVYRVAVGARVAVDAVAVSTRMA